MRIWRRCARRADQMMRTTVTTSDVGIVPHRHGALHPIYEGADQGPGLRLPAQDTSRDRPHTLWMGRKLGKKAIREGDTSPAVLVYHRTGKWLPTARTGWMEMSRPAKGLIICMHFPVGWTDLTQPRQPVPSSYTTAVSSTVSIPVAPKSPIGGAAHQAPL